MRQWYRMEAKASNDNEKVGEILIYDMIGKSWWDDNTVSAQSFNEDLKALGDVSQINLRINSPGGDVFDGCAIFNMLKAHKARVVGHVDGIAASAASLVLMAADEIHMPDNSFLLLHEPSTIAWGTADTMLAAAADLERITSTLVATYANRSGQSVKDVAALLKEDRLMTASEAKDLGYADVVDEPVKMAAAAAFDLGRVEASYRDKIAAAMEKARGATAERDVNVTVNVEVATGENAPEDGEGEGGAAADTGGDASGAQANAAKAASAVKRDVVVNLDDARKAGHEAGYSAAAEIAELCKLARAPEKAADFIAARKSVADVRAALVNAIAEADERGTRIDGKHAAQGSVGAEVDAAWARVIAKMNAKKK